MNVKTRGIVMGRKGIAASANPLITQAGMNILKKGGNAMDAAIAMANVSGVVLPDMCGLGGDCFLLYYDAATKQITAINGSGPAPKKASITWFHEHGYQRIPSDGMLSVAVPGAVATYVKALELFGTMQFKDLIAEACELAEDGLCVSEKVARHMRTDYEKLLRYDGCKALYLRADASPFDAGDVYANKEYAASLRKIGEEGKDAFYEGAIAEQIVAHSHRHHGLLELEDLHGYEPEVSSPIAVRYRDHIVYQTPPVSQGIIHLEELNILNQLDLAALGYESAEAIHAMVEAKKLAFMDRNAYFGDPEFVQNPIDHILSEAHGKALAARISFDQSLDTSEDTIGYDPHGHTTSLVVVDQDGNGVSLIHSVSATWGSGEIVEGTGILLNNRAATGFNLNPAHPNCLLPGKKCMHTLNTYMITDEAGNLRYVGNTPGGDNQPQWNMQVVCNVLDFHLDVQCAVEGSKWADAQSTNPYGGQMKNVLKIEEGLAPEVYDALRHMGHELQIIPPYTCSGASQLIEIRADHVVFAGSDPRADGCAMAEV